MKSDMTLRSAAIDSPGFTRYLIFTLGRKPKRRFSTW